jgi:hypothetical protein
MDIQSLSKLLYIFFDWHPARITSFSELIFGVIKARTVKIKELASHVSSSGAMHAKIAKVERFFLKQELDFSIIGKIIVQLLSIAGKLTIAIDRTNWQFGENDLNFFVAAIVYGNISIPIAWLLLDKKGNSNTQERKGLIRQILAIVPKERIKIILADREFVGEEWFEYLLKTEELPFAIRIKKCEQIRHPNGGKMKCGKYFAGMQPGKVKTEETKIYGKLAIKITCLQLEREQLFVASNKAIGSEVLAEYKKRWGIERSFRSLKTSGFNIEDTHMTNHKKLWKLFAIVSIALAICVIAGEIKNKTMPIIIKKHGRKLVSLFTYGFDWLKEYFFSNTKLAEPPSKSLFQLLIGHIEKAWL